MLFGGWGRAGPAIETTYLGDWGAAWECRAHVGGGGDRYHRPRPDTEAGSR
jgi:hypothetical protein